MTLQEIPDDGLAAWAGLDQTAAAVDSVTADDLSSAEAAITRVTTARRRLDAAAFAGRDVRAAARQLEALARKLYAHLAAATETAVDDALSDDCPSQTTVVEYVRSDAYTPVDPAHRGAVDALAARSDDLRGVHRAAVADADAAGGPTFETFRRGDRNHRRRVYETALSDRSAVTSALTETVAAHADITEALCDERDTDRPAALAFDGYLADPVETAVTAAAQTSTERLLSLRVDGTPRPYDLFAPVVADRTTVPFETATDIVRAAASRLGERYADCVGELLSSDALEVSVVDERPSGQTACAAGERLRVSVRYTPSLAGVATLAHEIGHAVHRLLLQRATGAPRGRPPAALGEFGSLLLEASVTVELLDSTTPTAVPPAETLDYTLAARTNTLHRHATFADFERRCYQSSTALSPMTLDDAYTAAANRCLPPVSLRPEHARKWTTLDRLYERYATTRYTLGTVFALAAVADGGPDVEATLGRLTTGRLDAATGDTHPPRATLDRASERFAELVARLDAVTA